MVWAVLCVIFLNWVVLLSGINTSMWFIGLQILLKLLSYSLKSWLDKITRADLPGEKLVCGDYVDSRETSRGKLCVGEVRKIMEKVAHESREDDDDEEEVEEEEEEEVRMEEVREAFGVFDENDDGFIDSEELKKVLETLGFFMEASEVECRRMIRAFDENGDGRIDFKEFVKLAEQSFSL